MGFTGLFLVVWWLSATWANGTPVNLPSFDNFSEASETQDKPTILVLDPVDLGKNRNRAEIGTFMQTVLRTEMDWTVVGADSLEIHMRNAGVELPALCREFQCAYEAATTLQVEFALFGTFTFYANMEIFALYLLHVPTVRVIWADAGDVRTDSQSHRPQKLAATLLERLATIHPDRIVLAEPKRRQLAVVIQTGPNILPGRILSEQVFANLASTRSYDLMSPTELSELLAVPEIQSAVETERWNHLARQLGVSRIFSANLEQIGKAYRARYLWGDVEEVIPIRQASSMVHRDFSHLLDFNTNFFEESLESGDDFYTRSRTEHRVPKRSLLKVGLFGLGLAITAASGMEAYLAWEAGYRESLNVKQARSQQTATHHQSQVNRYTDNVRRFGALGFVGAVSTIGMIWSF